MSLVSFAFVFYQSTYRTMPAGRPKGGEKKGGRKKGVPNKVTVAKQLLKTTASNTFAACIEKLTDLYFNGDNADQLNCALTDLMLMEAKDRFANMAKLLEYRIPKKRETDITVNKANALTLVLKQLAEKTIEE